MAITPVSVSEVKRNISALLNRVARGGWDKVCKLWRRWITDGLAGARMQTSLDMEAKEGKVCHWKRSFYPL